MGHEKRKFSKKKVSQRSTTANTEAHQLGRASVEQQLQSSWDWNCWVSSRARFPSTPSCVSPSTFSQLSILSLVSILFLMSPLSFSHFSLSLQSLLFLSEIVQFMLFQLQSYIGSAESASFCAMISSSCQKIEGISTTRLLFLITFHSLSKSRQPLVLFAINSKFVNLFPLSLL